MDYDVAVIGAGPGGYVAAIRAAQLGGNVCVVEKNTLGGTCLNRGCIPSKALLHVAKLCASVRGGEKFGLTVSDLCLDYSRLTQYKDAVVGRLNRGVAALLKANNVTVIEGVGRLTGKRQVTVGTGSGETVLEVGKIILATGSEVGRAPVFPFDDQYVITTDEALRWDRLPGRVLIVGAGASGCEFASALRDFGAEVCLVELLDQVLPGLDPDLAAELTRAFKKKGVDVRTGTRIESMTVQDGRVLAKAGDDTLEADVAIICTGRALNTGELGLEELSIRMDGKAIAINEHCQTSEPNIYAIGDNTGKSLLAHVAMRQGIVAAEHALGKDSTVDYALIPGCVYTEPEVASVGLTEAAARESGRKARSAKFPFMALGKAQAIGESEGFVKIVADEETDEVLGVQIIGPKATEMIAEATMVIRLEGTVEELAGTMHAHPTLSEAFPEAAELFLGQAIHTIAPRKKR